MSHKSLLEHPTACPQTGGVQSCTEYCPHCHQKFDTYPDTLVEIDERMHEFQVKADLCAGIDPRVSCVQCSMLRCVLAGLHKLKANMLVRVLTCAGGS